MSPSAAATSTETVVRAADVAAPVCVQRRQTGAGIGAERWLTRHKWDVADSSRNQAPQQAGECGPVRFDVPLHSNGGLPSGADAPTGDREHAGVHGQLGRQR